MRCDLGPGPWPLDTHFARCFRVFRGVGLAQVRFAGRVRVLHHVKAQAAHRAPRVCQQVSEEQVDGRLRLLVQELRK